MSSKSDKQRKQLKAYANRRGNRPAPSVPTPVPLKASQGLENRMIQDHQDVVQNVEFALVQAARESDDVDDRVVEEILRRSILYQTSDNPLVASAMNLMAVIRHQRPEISDDGWRDALRVIYTSLKRHSGCQAGDRDYLRLRGAVHPVTSSTRAYSPRR